MVARKRALNGSASKNYYFPKASTSVECIPSGCGVLDGTLCGGWPLGRIINIVGDRSSGKTLLAIEACANFARCTTKGKIWYRESEAAFDVEYAEGVGLPEGRVNFGPEGIDTVWDTVEKIFRDLEKKLDWLEAHPGVPALYIIDSLDALTTQAELDRDIDKGTYGQEKAKLLAQLFRRLVRRIKKSRMCVIVISQVRDKIGAMFGEKHTRSGGRALDFYASIIIWLHHIKTLRKQVDGLKQATGVRILAKTKKNKIGKPFRECQFDIRFGYGVVDPEASLEWLQQRKKLYMMGLKPSGVLPWLKAYRKMDSNGRAGVRGEVRSAVFQAWKEIDERTQPLSRKY